MWCLVLFSVRFAVKFASSPLFKQPHPFILPPSLWLCKIIFFYFSLTSPSFQLPLPQLQYVQTRWHWRHKGGNCLKKCYDSSLFGFEVKLPVPGFFPFSLTRPLHSTHFPFTVFTIRHHQPVYIQRGTKAYPKGFYPLLSSVNPCVLWPWIVCVHPYIDSSISPNSFAVPWKPFISAHHSCCLSCIALSLSLPSPVLSPSHASRYQVCMHILFLTTGNNKVIGQTRTNKNWMKTLRVSTTLALNLFTSSRPDPSLFSNNTCTLLSEPRETRETRTRMQTGTVCSNLGYSWTRLIYS